MTGQVVLRSAGPSHQAFLRSLHLDSRPELAALPLPPSAAAELVGLQLRAQQAEYQANYPEALDQIIELDGLPVGRCWTSQTRTELRLIDLAVLSAHQGQGVGRAVLAELIDRADAAAVSIQLTVWHANEWAQRLYQDCGFTVIGEHNGYLSMARAARTTSK